MKRSFLSSRCCTIAYLCRKTSILALALAWSVNALPTEVEEEERAEKEGSPGRSNSFFATFQRTPGDAYASITPISSAFHIALDAVEEADAPEPPRLVGEALSRFLDEPD